MSPLVRASRHGLSLLVEVGLASGGRKVGLCRPVGVVCPEQVACGVIYPRDPLFIDFYLVLFLVEVELVGHISVPLLRCGAHALAMVCIVPCEGFGLFPIVVRRPRRRTTPRDSPRRHYTPRLARATQILI